jgi:hypothetical protein
LLLLLFCCCFFFFPLVWFLICFAFWPLYFLSFFDLRFLITPFDIFNFSLYQFKSMYGAWI